MSDDLPENFSIRQAVPDDHASVSRLFESSYSALMRNDYEPAVLAAALPAITRANPMLLASGTFFVAETPGDRVVGCGGWTRERPRGGDVVPGLAHIRHFATHPEFTGRGIGRSLYNTCETQARNAGIERFECNSSLTAEGFYAALGFETIRRLDIEVGDRIELPAVLMVYALP